jgi:hypothetical protein
MPGRGPQTFKKRQKEQQRKEKQQEKMAKRLARKDGTAPTEDPDSDQIDAENPALPDGETETPETGANVQ